MAMLTEKSKIQSSNSPDEERRRRDQHRHDRTVAVLFILGFLAIIALLFWIASLGGTLPPDEYFEFMGL